MYSQQNDGAVIDLKLWIFKFICNDRDECAVCVEGYRKKDYEERELENWRSTTVKERYNSVTLVTVSGSRYILHGVIDQDSAYALGYPKTLIERFKDGFPYEWQDLLCEYYNNVIKPNKLNISQRLHSLLLGSGLLDVSKHSRNDSHRTSAFGNALGAIEISANKSTSALGNNAKRGKRLLIDEEILEEDEDETTKDKLLVAQSTSGRSSIHELSTTFGTPLATSSRDFTKQKAQKSADSYDSAGSREGHATDMQSCLVVSEQQRSEDKPQENTLFKMPLLPVQKRRAKPIELYSWTIRFSANELGQSKLFPNFAFVIIGFRSDKCLDWKTSCIIEVESSRLLRTATGTYELMGPINTILASQQGFPKEFVAQFLNGFPNDWHRILSWFFNTYIEPQLPPQQSLTISEIHDESDDVENAFGRKTDSRVENVNDSVNGDSNSDAFVNENARCGMEEQKSAKRAKSSGKSVQYRVDDWSRVQKRKESIRKSPLGRTPVVPAKRSKDERKGLDVPDIAVLKTTRSGRTVKPRMANWTGQRIVYNVRGSPVKAIGITTDSILLTSSSDTSLSSTAATSLHGTQCLSKNRKVNRLSTRTRNAHLVAYSDSDDSSSSCSSSDGEEDTGHPAPSPITPFYGKRGHHISRVIKSSPEEERKATKSRHKPPKRRTRARRNAVHKQRKKQKKGALLRNEQAGAEEDQKENGVEETVPIVSFSDVESEKGDRVVVEDTVKNVRKTKLKKWTSNENTRLKIAVEAMHPQSERDWEHIGTAMRTRTAEECRKQALEVLKLEVSIETNKKDVADEVVDALKKAKVGTLAYQIQADRFTRQFLKAGDGSDFFEDTMDPGPSGRKMMMPSVTSFDSDDSLLSVLRTPTQRPARRNNRRKKLVSIAETPSPDSPLRRSTRDSYVPFKFDPNDQAYRERQLRYVHKMMKVNRYNNTSRANTTKSSVSRDYHLHVPTVKRQLDDDNSDREGLDEDEYFEEEASD